MDNAAFLPENFDSAALRRELLLWSRVIVKRIDCLTDLQRAAVWHLPHEYGESTKKKTESVCIICEKNFSYVHIYNSN